MSSNDRSTLSPRLRGAGVGSIIGGLSLASLSFVVSYPVAAGIVLLGGLAIRLSGHRPRVALGIAAVGVIGVLEATGSFGVGLGLGPVVLGGLAIGAGLVDILLGRVVGRSSPSAGGPRE